MIVLSLITAYLIGCVSTYLAMYVQFDEHHTNGYLEGYKDGKENKENRME